MRPLRCTTTSGSYRCDMPAGHADACECEAPSLPWAGPAMLGLSHAAAGQRIGTGARVLPMRAPAAAPPSDLPPPPEAA